MDLFLLLDTKRYCCVDLGRWSWESGGVQRNADSSQQTSNQTI